MPYEIVRNVLIIIVAALFCAVFVKFGIDLYNLSNLGTLVPS